MASTKIYIPIPAEGNAYIIKNRRAVGELSLFQYTFGCEVEDKQSNGRYGTSSIRSIRAGALILKTFNLPEPTPEFDSISLIYTKDGQQAVMIFGEIYLTGITPYMSAKDMINGPIEFTFRSFRPWQWIN